MVLTVERRNSNNLPVTYVDVTSSLTSGCRVGEMGDAGSAGGCRALREAALIL